MRDIVPAVGTCAAVAASDTGDDSPSPCPVAANITASSVASSRAISAWIAPSCSTRVGPTREDLWQVARDEDDRQPRGGELGDDPVNLHLGADIDAAGRLVG
jgi:hypothetical protein